MGFINLLKEKFIRDRYLNYDEEDIKELQKTKLRSLIKYVYQNSEFYKNLYRQNGIKYKDLDEIELKNLPRTNKSIIMDNFNQVVTGKNIFKKEIVNFIDGNQDPTSLFKDKFHVIHSSGTSGEIGYYLYTDKNWELLKAVGASRLFKNFALKKKNYAFIGAADGHYAGISFFLSPVNRFEEYFYNNFLVIDINYPLKKYIKKLNNLQPDVISGYPSAIEMLLDYQKKKKLNIQPDSIICGGEPLTRRAEEKIIKYWDKKPVNYYGTSESIMIGSGVGREGLYIFDDLVILEFKEDQTLLTNLYNHLQPLIRYELDDLILKTDKQNKKWPFTYVKNISGREEDMLWMKNEENKKDFIHPIVFAEFYVKGLKKFQIIKMDELSLIFKAIKETEVEKNILRKRIKRRFKEILRKKKMNNLNIKIKFVDQLRNDPHTGKFKLIIKN